MPISQQMAAILALFRVDPDDAEMVSEVVHILVDFNKAPLDVMCWKYSRKAALN